LTVVDTKVFENNQIPNTGYHLSVFKYYLNTGFSSSI